MDLIDFSRYFAALLVVLGLLGGFALLAKRGLIPGASGGLPNFSGIPGLARFAQARTERRLAIQESLILDPRRRVVIVKVDEEEHVLLLGPDRETCLSTRPVKIAPVFEPIAPSETEQEAFDTAGPQRPSGLHVEAAE